MKNIYDFVRNHLQDRGRRQIHSEIRYHIHYRVMNPVWDRYHDQKDNTYDQIYDCLDT